MRESTSKLLADNCDEFLYYEDLGDEGTSLHTGDDGGKIPTGKREAFLLLFDSIRALQRENYDLLLPSRIKETMRRKQPSFSEDSYGYRSFGELLEDAEESGFLELQKDERSGTYVVTRLRTGRRRRRGKSGSNK